MTFTEGQNQQYGKGIKTVGKKRRRRTRAIDTKAEMRKLREEIWYGLPEEDAEDGTSPLEGHAPMPEFSTLIEQVVERENMTQAYKRVCRNKGSAGVDGVTVYELGKYVRAHWAGIKEHLLKGTYKPSAVRVVHIPKKSGGTRQLGIPTVVDRLIQQAFAQILSRIYEPTFSKSSYGFRPKKSAHMAVEQAKTYQQEGRRWVVDLDLAQFFDEVNHDRLMSCLEKRVKDEKICTLIRRYLKTGIMVEGLVSRRRKGTPQGSPLSPLLSNIVLDELDKELSRRKLVFCRYADDCNIYVRSRKAGDRVKESVTKYIEQKLRLKVNEKKSIVDRPWRRTFLGYSFTNHKKTKIRVPRETVQRFKEKLKQLFRKGRGRNIGRFIKETLVPAMRGWINYFRLSEVKAFVEQLDEWIRRRMRLLMWRQWKRPRTRRLRLMKHGLREERASKSAYNGRGPWWNAGSSHMNQAISKQYLHAFGLMSLLEKWRENKQ